MKLYNNSPKYGQYSNFPLLNRSKSGSKTAARNGKSRILVWTSTAQLFHRLQLGASHQGLTLGVFYTPTGSHTRSQALVLMPHTSTTSQPIITTLMVAWDTPTRDCGSAQGLKTLGSIKRMRTVVDFQISGLYGLNSVVYGYFEH